MQLFINERIVLRNRRLSRWMMFGGLGLSVVAVIITFTRQEWIVLAFGLILLGGMISQIGTAIHNRFGRSPRVEEVLDFSLKGLDDRHATFHYFLNTDHALITPNGAYALIPRLEKGEVTFKNGVWQHSPPPGRLSLGRSRQRKLNDLGRQAQRESERLQRFLRRKIPRLSEIETQPLVVFLANDAQIQADDTPLLAVHRKKLKDTLRKQHGGQALSAEDIAELARYLRLA